MKNRYFQVRPKNAQITMNSTIIGVIWAYEQCALPRIDFKRRHFWVLQLQMHPTPSESS